MLIKTEPYYQRARAQDSSDLSVSRFFLFSPFNVFFRFFFEKRKKKKRKTKERRAFSRSVRFREIRNSNPFPISLLFSLQRGCDPIFSRINPVKIRFFSLRVTDIRASCCWWRQGGAGPGYSVAGRFSNYWPVVGRPEGSLTSSESNLVASSAYTSVIHG